MNKKILYGFLPIFLSLVVLLVPMRAAAAVGVGSMWDGTVSVSYALPMLYLDNTYVFDYYTDSVGQVIPKTTLATYESTDSVLVNIQSDYSGVYLNGSVRKRVTISSRNTASNARYEYITASSDPVVLDGIYITTVLYDKNAQGDTVYDIYIQFNNYYVEQSTITVPLNIKHVINVLFNTYDDAVIDSQVVLNYSVSDDYAGTIMKYDRLEDVPTVDGYMSQQNQTIIDQSQTQNNLTTEQNTLIQDQTQQQHNDSQAEINQSIQNTDQITNGYNSSQMGDAENKFESGAGDLTDIEDTLTDSSSDYVHAFTADGFDTSFLQSVGPSLNYVVTWFTNFWNMGGALTSTYGLSFAIFIAFYILRVRG